MKIIVINGCAESGKDSFVEFAMEGDYPVYNFSTVDFIKDVARNLGWNGTKDERGRRLLSDLKDALSLYDDIPYKKVLEKIKQINEPNAIVFVHSREPKDMNHWVESTGAKSLFIRRPAAEDVQHNNHADNGVFDYDYDYVYSNEESISKLREGAIKFTNWIGEKDWQSFVE